MGNNKEIIAKANQELESLRKEVEKLKSDVHNIFEQQDEQDQMIASLNDKAGHNNNTGRSDENGKSRLSHSELSEIKEALKSLGKRTNGLEQSTDHLKKETITLN